MKQETKQEIKVSELLPHVNSISFSLELSGGDKVLKSQIDVLMDDIVQAYGIGVNISEYSKDTLIQSILSETNLFEYFNSKENYDGMVLTTLITVDYKGAKNHGLIESKISLYDLVNLCTLNGKYDRRLEPMVLKGCVGNLFTEFLTNFNTDYGIYVPPIHLKPLEATCVSCGVSFDDGSILENFIKQGRDGVEYYQRHPQDILVESVNACYSEPFRFGSIIHVKVQGSREHWYECPKCKTKQSFYNK